MSNSLIDLLVDALSVHRLTHLLVDDAILDGPRARYVDRMNAAGHDKLAYLATCPWCVSPYLAVGVVIARRLAPRAWLPVARVLAFSAIAGILAER